jgi:hypothetical protein
MRKDRSTTKNLCAGSYKCFFQTTGTGRTKTCTHRHGDDTKYHLLICMHVPKTKQHKLERRRARRRINSTEVTAAMIEVSLRRNAGQEAQPNFFGQRRKSVKGSVFAPLGSVSPRPMPARGTTRAEALADGPAPGCRPPRAHGRVPTQPTGPGYLAGELQVVESSS